MVVSWNREKPRSILVGQQLDLRVAVRSLPLDEGFEGRRQAHPFHGRRVQAADQATGLFNRVLQQGHAVLERLGGLRTDVARPPGGRLQVHAGGGDILDQTVVDLEGDQALLLLLQVEPLPQRLKHLLLPLEQGFQHAAARDRALKLAPMVHHGKARHHALQ